MGGDTEVGDPRVLPACKRAVQVLFQDFAKRWGALQGAVVDNVAGSLESLRIKDKRWTVTTTNTHYLEDSSDAMLRHLHENVLTAFEQDRQARAAAGPLSKAYGFWKVQQKRVPDEVQNFTRARLMVAARRELETLLAEAPGRNELHVLVKEGGLVQRKRERAQERLTKFLLFEEKISTALSSI